jgi:hypothetical protein
MAQSQRHLRSGVPYIYWQNFFVIFDQTQTKFFHRLTLVAIIKILMKTEIIEKPPRSTKCSHEKLRKCL